MQRIELLESRIAPASLTTGIGDRNLVAAGSATSLVISADAKTATWTDQDGDLVTLKVSKPILNAEEFIMSPDGLGHDFALYVGVTGATADLKAPKVSLSVTVQKGASGDGEVQLGEVDGSSRNFSTVSLQGNTAYFTANNVDTFSAKSFGVDGEPGGTPGKLEVTNKLGALQIGGSVHNSVVLAKAIGKVNILNDFADSVIQADKLGSVNIGGSILHGAADGSALVSKGNIGPVTVKGSVSGRSANDPVVIHSGAGAGGASHFKSLRIMGDVTDSHILAGNADRGNSDIGPVTIDGSWSASVIAAGIDPGADHLFGTGDDRLGGTEPADPKIKVISRIAKITIGGFASGTDATDDSFGFFAQKLGAVRAGNAPLSSGVVSGTLDTFIAQIATRQTAPAVA